MNPTPSTPAAPPRRVLILGAGFGTANRGVAALACGTLASLYHSFPDASVMLLDYARQPVTHVFRCRGRTHSIPTVALRFSKNLLQPNHVVRLLVTAALLRLLPVAWRSAGVARNPWLRAIAEADLVGALSGGDSFSSLYGLRRLLYVALPQFLVLALDRPLVQLPQSYGPFASPAARLVARKILTASAQVFSREAAGAETIAQIAPGARARTAVAYDLGFALEPHPAPRPLLDAVAALRREHPGPVVGLNVSGLLHASRGRDPFGLCDDYGAAMHDLLIYLVEWSRCAVVLVPHVFGAGGESDVTAAEALWQSLPDTTARRVFVVTEDLDQHEVKDLIRHCDVFAGARMHACIAALSQTVPTVAFAYSNKFAGVLGSIGSNDLVVDLRRSGRNQMIAALAHTLAHREEIRTRLEKTIPVVRTEVLGFFRRLAPPGQSAPRPEGRPVLQPDFDAA